MKDTKIFFSRILYKRTRHTYVEKYSTSRVYRVVFYLLEGTHACELYYKRLKIVARLLKTDSFCSLFKQ